MAEEKKSKAIAPWQGVEAQLSSPEGKQRLAAALPKHLSADQLIRSFVTAIRADQSGKLGACSKASLVEGVSLAAQLGLSLAPALGQFYLVPFKMKDGGGFVATPIIGYRGLIALAYQSGAVDKIVGRAVHANDQFAYRYGTDEAISHVPAAGDRGAPVCSYAVAWLRGSASPIFVVCTGDDLRKARESSRSGKSGPWATHPGEMAQKTAIRRLCKLLPLSAEDRAAQGLAQAVELDDMIEAGRERSQRGAVEQLPAEDVGGADPWAEAGEHPDAPPSAATSVPQVTRNPLLEQLLDEIEAGGWDPLSWYETIRGGGVELCDLTDADVPRLRGLWGRRTP